MTVSKPQPVEGYKIQISPNINGELYNIRADSVEDLLAVTKELGEKGPELVENVNVLRQVVIADSILTTRQSTPVGLPANSDEDFTCKHGKMKDLSDKNYKYTHYCPEKDRANQCPPKGKK